MRAVIFDLDGTLMNTIGDITDAINYARLCFEGDAIAQDEVMRYVGSGLRKALTSALIEHGPRLESEEEEELMFQILMQYYKNHPNDKAVFYDGIPELLCSLKRSGYKLAILSNKADEIVQKIATNCFDPGLFDIVRGKIASMPLKPDPKAIFSILDDLGVKKEDAIYIGDSEVDFRSAENASIRRIIVNYGFRSGEFLSELGISSIDHVPSLEEINAQFL